LRWFLFAENSYVLSPVDGNWSNYQSIIIDVPEGATAFYSFTGDNPLYSGFAYESPVLLELEGDINLKVAILNKDNSLIEENINFSNMQTIKITSVGREIAIDIASDI
jgi:hypothetical protein